MAKVPLPGGDYRLIISLQKTILKLQSCPISAVVIPGIIGIEAAVLLIRRARRTNERGSERSVYFRRGKLRAVPLHYINVRTDAVRLQSSLFRPPYRVQTR